MGYIKKSENTFKELCAKYPKLNGKIMKFMAARQSFAKAIEGYRLYLAFQILDIENILTNSGGYFEYVATRICGISRSSLYGYKNYARHCLSNCPCLKGKTAAEVVALFDAKSAPVEKIFEELGNKFPGFSQKDFYAAELPAPKERVKFKEEDAAKIIDENFELYNEFKDAFGVLTARIYETDPKKQLFKYVPSVELKDVKEKLEEASSQIDEILEERRRLEHEQ